ncbi:hypothetical protein TOPH_06756, partial [Tolypocladium ophioglossoides CBS 100239]
MSPKLNTLVMDISKYVAEAGSYDKLSAFQISRVFERHGPTTRGDCDRLAADILGCLVAPTPVQGATSYTELIELARQSYRDPVPNCKPHGTMLGDVHVCVWDLVPEPTFYRVRRQFLVLNIEIEQRLYQTMEGFSRFFALAWNNRPSVERPPGLPDEYYGILDQVSQGLPEHLQAKLYEVRRALPLLFRPGHPMAFQHDDLLENNIHVDEATGRITGIVNWPDAIIAPFGVSLDGLETILGVQTLTSWHFHPGHLSLRGRY